MYITEVLTKTKSGKISHRCVLLRESYRENGKVKNRTVANLTHADPKVVQAMRLALKHKNDLSALKSTDDVLEIKQGKSIGAIWTVYQLAKRLGIEKALGTTRNGKLALWQIFARIIDQGSRLSAVRLAQEHAGCDAIGIEQGFNEDHLYNNLAWLSENQATIERRLFNARCKNKRPQLFLYDVTSSYLEGTENELADWGYNRDKKSGKLQLVVGLLCDEDGEPVSVEVFNGNTSDQATFGSQIQKAAQNFGVDRVTFVGDRGMIKSNQIVDLDAANFSYITAITKAQINKLLRTGSFQMELFENTVCEIECEGNRYIFRRNPQRAQEIAQNRSEKFTAIEQLCRKQNEYLTNHLRAKVSVALGKVEEKIKKLKCNNWIRVEADERTLRIQQDEEALETESKLDGCYCLKSNLPKDVDKQVIHDRYRDLATVETAFRTCKTTLLEMRPWYVQNERSTRGHALVVMLSYLITRKLKELWQDIDLTVAEGLTLLSGLCTMQVTVKDSGTCHRVPTPNDTCDKLLQAAKITLPEVIPSLGANVVSRKKLPKNRINR